MLRRVGAADLYTAGLAREIVFLRLDILVKVPLVTWL
jgi:hypothetical protein